MAGFTYPVSSVVNSIPAVRVTTGYTLSYEQMMTALGTTWQFMVDSIYTYSPVKAQISVGYTYSRYNVDGRRRINPITPALDPYQLQNSFSQDVKQQQCLIDGRGQFNISILPLTSLDFYLTGTMFESRRAMEGSIFEQTVRNLAFEDWFDLQPEVYP